MLNEAIPFNLPFLTGQESSAITEVLNSQKFSGAGGLTRQCQEFIEHELKCQLALLVPSCTAALEMAALLIGIGPGDEVIMPSYTFVSTANAFALRGAKICFVDVDPLTMTADPTLIETAINKKTKAIVTVPYNGIHGGYERIKDVVVSSEIFWVEDSAQAWGSTLEGKAFGTFGDFGALSFHETKNIHCGEGGCLLVNNQHFVEAAKICREKGTDRSRFLKGEVDKYTWQELGSSYLPSEFQAAVLKTQLERSDQVTRSRAQLWHQYTEGLSALENSGTIELQHLPGGTSTNGHLFYLKAKDANQRQRLKEFLNARNIQTATHYEPLHTAPGGRKFGYFFGQDRFTSADSARLLRLPLFFGLTEAQVDYVCSQVNEFFSKERYASASYAASPC